MISVRVNEIFQYLSNEEVREQAWQQEDIFWEMCHAYNLRTVVKCRMLYSHAVHTDVVRNHNRYIDCNLKQFHSQFILCIVYGVQRYFLKYVQYLHLAGCHRGSVWNGRVHYC